MNAKKREQIRRTLTNLAAAQASTIQLMEQTLALISDELALDPLSYWKSWQPLQSTSTSSSWPVADEELLEIRYQDRRCFLGNTLPFRFFARLTRRPNSYLTYEELLEDVWQGERSDSAIRTVVKRLRILLRRAEMADLAEAIDGSVPGRYALRLGK
jgi:hypothetical protein